MNNRGQSLIMFALIIAGVMAILISTVLLSINDLEKEVDRAKVRINSYQATIQVAQILQTALDLGNKDASCALFPGVVRITAGGKVLCMPASIPCISLRYCIEGGSPSYNVTAIERIEPPTEMYAESPPWRSFFPFEISLWPSAQAQASVAKLQPTLPSPPSSAVGVPTCPDVAQRCVTCSPAAGANADCFKVRICTNRSTTCTNQENYYEAQLAMVFQK